MGFNDSGRDRTDLEWGKLVPGWVVVLFLSIFLIFDIVTTGPQKWFETWGFAAIFCGIPLILVIIAANYQKGKSK